MPDLRSINRFPSLVKYLRDELDWPIESDDFEDLVFDFTPEELGIDKKNAAKIEEIKRLRPLSTNQPWGIFFVKFDRKKLPVVALRRLLNAVALKKRASANRADQAAWHANDLLFISNYGEEDDRKICFANFSQDEEKNDLPVLKVLGWDDKDTALHLDDVAKTLENKFTWDEDYTEDPEGWGNQWRSAFSLAYGEVVQTSKDMAIQLAHLAQKIRIRINEILAIENDKGPITSLMAAFKEALIDDLDEDGFADMYAQTIAYGLLSARITNPSGESADDLPSAMPITNPFLRELMEQFLQVGGRKKGKKLGTGIDFDELGVSDVIALLDAANMEAVLKDFGDQNPQEDPVIHFFEGFLQEYDSQIRKDRGVFYTPRPVVSFIVRSVDELLRTEFGLEDGLADTTTWGEMAGRIDDLEIPEGATATQAFVQILDPATGTGTFLVEVIDLIHKTMTAKWQAEGHGNKKIEKLWNAYVPKHLLPRLHGYELMMAPYAIAHMKIGLKLYETRYRFESDERARVYLTNALEPAQDFSGTLAFAIPALAHEAEAVNAIKRDQRFTVVIGNPPYSSLSQNMGKWIKDLVAAFRKIDGVPIAEKGKRNHLQDDYVKFMRLALMHEELSGCGICGLITNHGYIYSPTFRAMRHYISKAVTLGRFLDLNGNAKRDDARAHPGDENVFDIQQGVAIAFLCNSPRAKTSKLVNHSLFGNRATKYRILSEEPPRFSYEPLHPRPPFFLFETSGKEGETIEYDNWPKLDEMMPFGGTGIKTNRDDFAVAFDDGTLLERMKIFGDASVSDDSAQKLLGLKENYTWKIPQQRQSFRDDDDNDRIRPVEYRPFDTRRIYYQKNVVYNPRFETMSHARSDNLFLLACRQQYETGFRHAFVTRELFECCLVSNKSREITSGFPLFLFPESRKGGELFDSPTREINLSRDYLNGFRDRLGVSISGTGTNTVGKFVSGEDVLGYIYGVLCSPSFRARYAESLKLDFPRIPWPNSLALFREISSPGRALVRAHLLEMSAVENSVPTYFGSANPTVEKISFSGETVWLNVAKDAGFEGVPEEVWNFQIGSYQVCEKWLKDRQAKGGKNPRPGRVLTDEDIEHYQKIIVALSETIRIMAEIDEVIEAHGGWPGAFQTGDAESVNEES